MQQKTPFFTDCLENIGTFRQIYRGEGRQRFIRQFREVFEPGKTEQVFQVQHSADRKDVFSGGFQHFRKPFAGFARHQRGDFKADHVTACFFLKRNLHFSQQVGNGFLINREIHIAGDAECGTFEDRALVEQKIQIIGDQFFACDERCAVSVNFDFDKPRNQGRNFENGKLLPRIVFAVKTDQQLQSEVRNLRERMRAVNADRCKNRQIACDEPFAESIPSFLRKLIPGKQSDPVIFKFRQDFLIKGTVLPFHELANPGIELFHQDVGHITAAAVNAFERFSELLGDSGNTNHVELVQIAAENGDEFQAFKQGVAFVGGFSEHTGIEFKPTDVTIDVLFFFGWSRHNESFPVVIRRSVSMQTHS